MPSRYRSMKDLHMTEGVEDLKRMTVVVFGHFRHTNPGEVGCAPLLGGQSMRH